MAAFFTDTILRSYNTLVLFYFAVKEHKKSFCEVDELHTCVHVCNDCAIAHAQKEAEQ